VSCCFDLEHYAEILACAREGGYRFASYGRDPEPGDLFLRHDVDLSLEAALRMAEFEASAGVTAWYFLMRDSVFYNLASDEGSAALARLGELGHHVGCHLVFPDTQLDSRMEPVVAWHNPDPEYMSADLDEGMNVMSARYFDPATYRSDSNQRWRHGCPHAELRAGAFPWLQLLIHPEIWVYEGSTMNETMGSMLDAERERRPEQLRADRIDLS